MSCDFLTRFAAFGHITTTPRHVTPTGTWAVRDFVLFASALLKTSRDQLLQVHLFCPKPAWSCASHTSPLLVLTEDLFTIISSSRLACSHWVLFFECLCCKSFKNGGKHTHTHTLERQGPHLTGNNQAWPAWASKTSVVLVHFCNVS